MFFPKQLTTHILDCSHLICS